MRHKLHLLVSLGRPNKETQITPTGDFKSRNNETQTTLTGDFKSHNNETQTALTGDFRPPNKETQITPTGDFKSCNNETHITLTGDLKSRNNETQIALTGDFEYDFVFTVLQIKFECRQFPSIFVEVMPLSELKILEIHSFLHFPPTCFDLLT